MRLTTVGHPGFAAGNGREGVLFDARFDELFDLRKREADEFYADLTPPSLGGDAANVLAACPEAE